MHNHPLLWLFITASVLLAILLYVLWQSNKRLKTALKDCINVSPSSLQKLEMSQKIINANLATFLVILVAISAIFVYLNFFYVKNGDIVIIIFEVVMISVGLFAGYLLGGSRSKVEAEHHFNQFVNQTSQREWVERRISLSEDRLENQQLALATLTQNQLHDWHDPSEVFREMAMISAQTLNVERVGVWLFNEDRTQLNCSDLYLKTKHLHTEAEPLVWQDLPQYFNALENNRLIVAHDVMQHEATVELIHDYLPAHNIGATLEGTIWINNQFIGVICHEHVGGAREWALDEQNFVSSIAALASLTIETHRRRKAELALAKQNENLEQLIQTRTRALQESNQRFSYVVQEAPIAILIIDRYGNIVDVNNEAVTASGYSREQLLGKSFIVTVVAKKSRMKAKVMAERALRGENFKNVELMLQNAKGEKYEYECSIGLAAGSTSDGSSHMVAIAQNISQQKALQKSLIKAREAAEGADRTKSMFVAAMSHELRTPLNSIIGFIGVVLQGISGALNPAQKGQLNRAYESSKHLLLLISDVLDASKIEAGFLQLDTEKFELKPLFTEAEHAVQHLLAGKNLALSVDCAAKLQLETDRKRLYQVVLNVLSNAIKYTEHGKVKVSAQIDGNQLKISCQDTGIGINDADITQLFQPFVRLKSHLKIKTPGTGLGLYLSQKILTQLLGGSMTVQSELGQGSTFNIIIPINAPVLLAPKAFFIGDGDVEESILRW